MAPEMLIMECQRSADKRGYTLAVDYWSLGVMMFYLLNGTLPFAKDKVADLYQNQVESRSVTPPLPVMGVSTGASTKTPFATKANSSSNEEKSTSEMASQFVRFLTKDNDDINRPLLTTDDSPMKLFKTIPKGFERLLDISNSTGLSPDALSIIMGLLTVDERARLGSGASGNKKIRLHPFFKSISWNLLVQKMIDPPYIPVKPYEPEPQMYKDYYDMLDDLDKGDWTMNFPNRQGQSYFATW